MTSLIKRVKTPDDRIDFIFDTLDGDAKDLLLAHYERYMALAPARFRAAGSALPKFASEEDCLPLQAADMMAWHARHYYWDAHLGRDADPSHADRQRRYRERKKASATRDVTRDVTVTVLDTDTEKTVETLVSPGQSEKIVPIKKKPTTVPKDFEVTEAMFELPEAEANAPNGVV